MRGLGKGWPWRKPREQIDGQEANENLLKLFPFFQIHWNPLDVESLSGLTLRLVKKEPRQLELTWAGSRPRSPGGNLTYELHILNQVRKQLRVSGSPCP